MASKQHNFIVSALVRKIRMEGFSLIYLDGKYQDVSETRYNIPPKAINHRPDIIGVKDEANFCIGEAKTKKDLLSERTRNQFKDFSALTNVGTGNKFYIGVPLSAKGELNKLLDNLNLRNNTNFEIIVIPDELLAFEDEV